MEASYLYTAGVPVTEGGSSWNAHVGPNDFEAAPKIVQRRREDFSRGHYPQPCPPEAAGTAAGNELAGQEAWYAFHERDCLSHALCWL